MENQQQAAHSAIYQQDIFYHSLSTDGGVSRQAPKEDEAVNSSCNHNGPSSIFNMPECVMDVYLTAINGGTSRDEKFRSISNMYGQKEEKSDFNCNHNLKINEVPPGYCGGCHQDACYDPEKNVNPEPKPNQGCGCSFSYNGGAGAGTADCGCDASYDGGFNDKKRDHSCPCSSPEARRSHVMGTSHAHSHDPYESELCNKKAMSSCCTGLSEVEYKPEIVNNKPVLPSCCCEGGPYEKDLINKKPSICSPCGPEFHSSCDRKQRNCHQGEFVTHREDIPSRRCFYSDEECGNTSVVKRCNNNSCNIDLVYGLSMDEDPCAVGVPCIAEASYFQSDFPGIMTTTLPAETHNHEDSDEEEEDDRPKAKCTVEGPSSHMYTTVALESDVEHLTDLSGGKRWEWEMRQTKRSHVSHVDKVSHVEENGKGCVIA